MKIIYLMGGRSSRENRWRQSSSFRSTSSSSFNQYQYPQSLYPQENQNNHPKQVYPAYPPQQYNPPPQNYGGRPQEPQRKLDRRYSRIADNYSSLEQVRSYAIAHSDSRSARSIKQISMFFIHVYWHHFSLILHYLKNLDSCFGDCCACPTMTS
ncbi:unnamed protein product [Ilex paraguariensis]|uniref:Uncharacterized protein n=1 Tax=Ilex paraguariensis TaxID=185542 RepID=A0ABC8UHI9_9AQUA